MQSMELENAQLRAMLAELEARQAQEYAARLAENAAMMERIKALEACLVVPDQIAKSAAVATRGVRELNGRIDAQQVWQVAEFDALQFRTTRLEARFEAMDRLIQKLTKVAKNATRIQKLIIQKLESFTPQGEPEIDPDDPYADVRERLGPPM